MSRRLTCQDHYHLKHLSKIRNPVFCILAWTLQKIVPFTSGVILNEFMEAANNVIAGQPVAKRFRLFTSADFNIGAMMDVSKIEGSAERGIPAYASLFALELHRCKKSGEYFVLVSSFTAFWLLCCDQLVDFIRVVKRIFEPIRFLSELLATRNATSEN